MGDIHKGDFVEVSSAEAGTKFAGMVLAIGDEVTIEVYNRDGATGVVRGADPENVELHPIGRVSVMESINDPAHDNTNEDT